MIKFKTKCGYIAYKCTYDEIMSIHGGIAAYRCDKCSAIDETYYMVPVLNGAYCSKCFDKWNNPVVPYNQGDLAFQNSFIKYIEELAKSVGVSIKTED